MEKTGLFPFNLEIVLSKVREYQNMQSTRLTTPPSELIPDTILDRIPHSAKEIVDQGGELQLLSFNSFPPSRPTGRLLIFLSSASSFRSSSKLVRPRCLAFTPPGL